MFTKKRIIITIISAVLVAALAVGAVFIVGGLPETPQRPKQLYKKEYVKEGMPDITFKFNGKDIVFKYKYTTMNPFDAQYSLDGSVPYSVTDRYESEDRGLAKKYEGEDTFYYIHTSFDDSKPGVTLGEIEETAVNAVNSSDFGISVSKDMIERLEETADSKNLFKYPQIKFEMDDKTVRVFIDSAGKVYSIGVSKKFNSDGISEKRKAVAKAKLDKRIAELKETDEKGEWVLESTYYHEMNGKPYVSYTMMHYLDPETTDACMAFTFYCQV